MGSFHRVDTDQVIRGAARILAAPIGQAKPRKISDVLELRENQSQITTLALGAASAGTFTLTVNGQTTAAIAFDADAAEVEAALVALSNVDDGDIEVTGATALPTGPLTLTFGGALAAQDVTITGDGTGLTGGALALTDTQEGIDQYSPVGGWYELGATRDGIGIAINNEEDSFEVDQVQGEIGTSPTNWSVVVSTNFAEMTMEKFSFVWEGTEIVTDVTPDIPEREVGFAGATNYTKRRLAVAFKRNNGAIQLWLFHQVVRSPTEVNVLFQKSGDPMTLAYAFRALADSSEPDPRAQFGRVREQVIEAA